MSFHVCHGATLQCSKGQLPSRLLVLPDRPVRAGGLAAAHVGDHRSLVNIVSFGACLAGVLPRRCVPETPRPWTPGAAQVRVVDVPALDGASRLVCAVGGVIRIVAGTAGAPRLP